MMLLIINIKYFAVETKTTVSNATD